MKTIFAFALLLFFTSACSVKEISPDGGNKISMDEQPPKNECSGRPNCK